MLRKYPQRIKNTFIYCWQEIFLYSFGWAWNNSEREVMYHWSFDSYFIKYGKMMAFFNIGNLCLIYTASSIRTWLWDKLIQVPKQVSVCFLEIVRRIPPDIESEQEIPERSSVCLDIVVVLWRKLSRLSWSTTLNKNSHLFATCDFIHSVFHIWNV